MPPLIFWLLIGYFYEKPWRMLTIGLYRVTSSDTKVRALEHHMSQGNYQALATKLAEPHVIANYLKRLLRESKLPLLPKAAYEALLEVEGELPDLKSLVDAMPVLNKNILQMIIKYCKHLAEREPTNKMTSYNLAVTLGPSIFRAEVEEADIASHANFY